MPDKVPGKLLLYPAYKSQHLMPGLVFPIFFIKIFFKIININFLIIEFFYNGRGTEIFKKSSVDKAKEICPVQAEDKIPALS